LPETLAKLKAFKEKNERTTQLEPWTSLLENLRFYSYYVIGKSEILFLLRNSSR
jgi:hypothetical protein